MNLPMPRSACRLLSCWCGMCLGLVGAGCARIPHSGELIPVAAEPSRTEPVTAALAVERLTVQAGETFQVLVQVRVAGGSHIYGTDSPPTPFSPTAISLILPEGLEPAGDWIVPKPTVTKTGERVYTDSILFRRQLKVRLNAPGERLSIKGELLYQACTDELCWPPEKIALSTSVAVVSKTAK